MTDFPCRSHDDSAHDQNALTASCWMDITIPDGFWLEASTSSEQAMPLPLESSIACP